MIRDANEYGAAVLAVPMKATVKESDDGQFVLQTIDRSRLWEIHTPQVIRVCVQWCAPRILVRPGHPRSAKNRPVASLGGVNTVFRVFPPVFGRS